MNQHTRCCPVCRGDHTVPLHLNTHAALDGLDMSYRVARCVSCGFVFADQLPSPAAYAAYYRSLSKYDIAPGSGDLSVADRLRCDAAVAVLRPHAKPDARIADLGCGSGMLLGALKAAGWSRLDGIDPAPGAPHQASQQFELDCVRCGTLDQAATLLDLAATDVICLTGVLEHLPQVREDLEALTAAIGDDTRILVEVPALERFAHHSFEPHGEFSLEHIQYFSADSLKRLFAELGFTSLSSTIVDLPPGYCDSLFALFARDPATAERSAPTATNDGIKDYIARSEAMTRAAVARITACPAKTMMIYGAGSHTARLLPRLIEAGESRLAGLVDSNPNLRGKRLGPLLIETPDALDRHPDATIVVSSFRSQQTISDALRASRSNPVLTLY
ncbi:MAG: class I SAM-dependent methyltransferase [Sulfuritalea sp.]|nr:class I SAM-dependent methyltransferase [Sulfuritalea sp.]